MKYVMLCINRKYNEQNEPVIRRVLLEYTTFINNEFSGTRFIDSDDYFKDKNSSHQYVFNNDSYYMLTGYDFDNYLANKVRKYHTVNADDCEPILFEADTDEEAIKQFHERKELR